MSNDIVNDLDDELLNDLKELDEATDDMQETIKTSKTIKKTVESIDSAEVIDASTLALETARIAQASAESSHHAIDAAIHLSHEQKQQVLELSDSNIAWRHSVGKANKTIEASRNTVAIMLGVSIVFSAISIGVASYLYFSTQKNNKQMEGEVLDIISTELSLSSKKQEIRLDQLTAMIESINARKNIETVKTTNGIQPIVLNELNEQVKANHQAINTTAVAFDDSQIKQQLVNFSKQQKQQMAKIEMLLAKINQNQTSLTKSQTATKMINPIKVTAMGLTESQLKKLNKISSAVYNQSKILQAIQRKVNAQNTKTKRTYIYKKTPNNDKKLEILLTDLKGQITQIQNQQTASQAQLQSLETKIKKQNAIPKEYRYRSRD